MAVEKLSISMDSELVRLVRDAATSEGMTISSWLSEAATARARQHALREAIAGFDKEHGALTLEEAQRIAAEVRAKSRIVRPKRARKR